ncbi:uncharacterized protein PODANS_7_5820 [Podospora anserina S mat+]|uniref:Podospora anserina S mat+ genomic DNA chromosome 7, supercontig 1 n=1 Tax=Podospora anserina (strain S / ATCC MYA-4624 / DSM 980 / FGSC 10383) TaxID=515849 RepID=B2AW36_PODAN|nr:uncharacterized protein PODANS_7_5820 [Podospora anserina S mat+]CAP68610.1 unnamed protein product [Podospora anserina S mat+]CDP32083.1 Putative protein of unknown function [Podospora anserina S mat+]
MNTDSDLYDPDEVLPRNSPLLQPLRPTLRPPTPSPPPITSPQSISSASSFGDKKPRVRMPRPTLGDGILISYLDNHRQHDIALQASVNGLPCEPESPADTDLIDDTGSLNSAVSPGGRQSGRDNDKGGGTYTSSRMSVDPPGLESLGGFDLKSLAAGALAAVITDAQPEAPTATETKLPDTEAGSGLQRPQPPPAPPAPPPPVLKAPVIPVRSNSFRDERPAAISAPPPVPPYGPISPREQGHHSPSNSITSATLSEGLAPLKLNSLRFENNGPTLPSIRSTFGDINQLRNNVAAEHERMRSATFPRSPPATTPRLPSLGGHGSPPPLSPVDSFRGPLSPSHSLVHPAASPPGTYGGYYAQMGSHPRQSDYASSSTATPGSEQSASTPGANNSNHNSIDRIGSIPLEGVTHIGTYVCKFSGCNAQPFATQYLLNSHANVHSSARPHYCPVAGCPRSEGGKGFKRKNEMIRHGLVHDSPGYVCPFCPDREHKYPRPDNLQRHVRVHHVDKDKDDPLLRDVLSQRPDGPSRGRRRRGGPG